MEPTAGLLPVLERTGHESKPPAKGVDSLFCKDPFPFQDLVEGTSDLHSPIGNDIDRLNGSQYLVVVGILFLSILFMAWYFFPYLRHAITGCNSNIRYGVVESFQSNNEGVGENSIFFNEVEANDDDLDRPSYPEARDDSLDESPVSEAHDGLDRVGNQKGPCVVDATDISFQANLFAKNSSNLEELDKKEATTSDDTTSFPEARDDSLDESPVSEAHDGLDRVGNQKGPCVVDATDISFQANLFAKNSSNLEELDKKEATTSDDTTSFPGARDDGLEKSPVSETHDDHDKNSISSTKDTVGPKNEDYDEQRPQPIGQLIGQSVPVNYPVVNHPKVRLSRTGDIVPLLQLMPGPMNQPMDQPTFLDDKKKKRRAEYAQPTFLDDKKKKRRAEYAQQKVYRNKPEVKKRIKAQQKAYRNKPEVKKRIKAYNNKPEVKKREKAYNNKPEVKKRKREQRREKRQRICGEYSLTNFENRSVKEVCGSMMNGPQEKLGGLSLREYAKDVSPVYILMTGQESVYNVRAEFTGFLHQDSRTNPVLMWNPKRVEFPNNICPYEEKDNHGFVPITKAECNILGFDTIVLLDQHFPSRKDCCKVEQGCQYEIDDLLLGTQRLHRRPGAAMPHSEGEPGRYIVAATYAPPKLFQDHPDIVTVGSADGRNGYGPDGYGV